MTRLSHTSSCGLKPPDPGLRAAPKSLSAQVLSGKLRPSSSWIHRETEETACQDRKGPAPLGSQLCGRPGHAREKGGGQRRRRLGTLEMASETCPTWQVRPEGGAARWGRARAGLPGSHTHRQPCAAKPKGPLWASALSSVRVSDERPFPGCREVA